MPAPLDFTVYRSPGEPAGVSLPDVVRQAIEFEHPRWITIYDQPVVRPVYGCDPLPEGAALFVHCNRWPEMYVGGARVIVFSAAGKKLCAGPDGDE